jgi:hypothetical protein
MFRLSASQYLPPGSTVNVYRKRGDRRGRAVMWSGTMGAESVEISLDYGQYVAVDAQTGSSVLFDYAPPVPAPATQGEQGATGPAGSQGIPGTPGQDGARGAKGDTGPMGERGPTGPAGPAGGEGPRGMPGVQGEVGERGATGPSGEIGPRGETGPTGPAGPQGIPGPAGAKGPIGDTGPQGGKGEQGIPGPVGSTGPTGALGPKGDTGATGATGPAGTQPVRFAKTVTTDTNGAATVTFPTGLFSAPPVVSVDVQQPSGSTRPYQASVTSVTANACSVMAFRGDPVSVAVLGINIDPFKASGVVTVHVVASTVAP